MDKLRKKGVLSKTKNGQIVLENDNGEFYRINKSIAIIWNMLDGKTSIENIKKELINGRMMDRKEIEMGINNVISQLKKCELVEWIFNN